MHVAQEQERNACSKVLANLASEFALSAAGECGADGGRKAASVRLRLKPLIKSGFSAPMTFVRNEMTKKVSMIRKTM